MKQMKTVIKYHTTLTILYEHVTWYLATDIVCTMTRISRKRYQDLSHSVEFLNMSSMTQGGVSKIAPQIELLTHGISMLNILRYRRNCHAKKTFHPVIFQAEQSP